MVRKLGLPLKIMRNWNTFISKTPEFEDFDIEGSEVIKDKGTSKVH